MRKTHADRLLPQSTELDFDVSDAITGSIGRELTDEELAHYSQFSPELEPVFDALISSHDSGEPNGYEQYEGELRW